MTGLYSLQHGSGDPGSIWFATLLVFSDFREAVTACLAQTRRPSLEVWRVVDGEGKQIVKIVPGCGGDA